MKFLVTIETTQRTILEVETIDGVDPEQVKANIMGSSPAVVFGSGKLVGQALVSQQIVGVDVNV